MVHDLLHQRSGALWELRVGAYRKLRLAPDSVRRELERRGFHVDLESGMSGMVRIRARAAHHT
ncbi:MAG: hypothetical protein WBE92_00575 [Steroidobacteraceae bacterium]